MSNNMRLMKFRILMMDVNRSTMPGVTSMFLSRGGLDNVCNNPSMLLIYDYDKLNDYGKIILERSLIYIFDWTNKYSAKSLIESKTKIAAAKDLVYYCKMEDHRANAYYFIFWAMLVLTVDKTDEDEKLSLICDFARMLNISDNEMIDIVQVIKVLYHEGSVEYSYKSNTIPRYFYRMLRMYEK